jgi:hypothetical protein
MHLDYKHWALFRGKISFLYKLLTKTDENWFELTLERKKQFRVQICSLVAKSKQITKPFLLSFTQFCDSVWDSKYFAKFCQNIVSIFFAKICQNLMSSKYFHKNVSFVSNVTYNFCLSVWETLGKSPWNIFVRCVNGRWEKNITICYYILSLWTLL